MERISERTQKKNQFKTEHNLLQGLCNDYIIGARSKNTDLHTYMKQTERWHGQTTNITDSIILNVKSKHMNGTDLGRDKFHYEFPKRPSLVVVYKKSCRSCDQLNQLRLINIIYDQVSHSYDQLTLSYDQ